MRGSSEAAAVEVQPARKDLREKVPEAISAKVVRIVLNLWSKHIGAGITSVGLFISMMKRRHTIQLAVLLACAVMGLIALAGEKPSPQPSPGVPGQGVNAIDFEKDVQPILKAACYECHSSKKIKGKLRLDA